MTSAHSFGPTCDGFRTVLKKVTDFDKTDRDGLLKQADKVAEATVEAFLKKVDPRGLSFSDIEGSMQYLETLSRHDMSAKCALNLALLDAAGKKAKKPGFEAKRAGLGGA